MPKTAQISEKRADHTQAAVVVSKAVVRASEMLGINNASLARIVGISPASASRLQVGQYVVPTDSKPYELALLVIRLFRSLDAMMGGEAASVRSWMTSPNKALRGIPLDLISTVPGLVETVAYVDSRRARI